MARQIAGKPAPVNISLRAPLSSALGKRQQQRGPATRAQPSAGALDLGVHSSLQRQAAGEHAPAAETSSIFFSSSQSRSHHVSAQLQSEEQVGSDHDEQATWLAAGTIVSRLQVHFMYIIFIIMFEALHFGT